MTNINEDEVIHDVMMRPEGGEEEELERPPYFRYDFDTDSPKLLTTFGRNCRVSSCPLHAQSQPYPLQPFTKRQCLFFHELEAHSPLVNRAIVLEGDLGLRAEVQRFRRKAARATEMARRLAQTKREYNSLRIEAERALVNLSRETLIHD
jgi:hypothetical protein